MKRSQITFFESPELTKSTFASYATDKNAFEAFWAKFHQNWRWSPSAEKLFRAAFPEAEFNSNLGILGTCSGSKFTDSNKNLYFAACSYAKKGAKTGWQVNISRGFVIPAPLKSADLKEVFTAEIVHQRFGFCKNGIAKFCEENGIAPDATLTRGQLQRIIAKNKALNCTKYKAYMRTMRVALACS